MRRFIYLLPLLALLGCPNSQQVHLLTDAPPQGGTMRCATARMVALGYVVQDTGTTGFFRVVTSTRREGALESILTARLFVYEETGVQRLAVRANQVSHRGPPPPSPVDVSSRVRADAQAIINSCGIPEPG
ncbi:MAG: hypothetical protein M3497_07430 [Gemmatimonadota bacterium]|nr:hypothetical protein [Gemmatimonadota bacterium]